jgi:hypothetical protein
MKIAIPKLTPVESSQIHSVGHKSGKLYVKFHKGSIYEYDGVKEEQYQAMLAAESTGKFFNSEIRANPKKHPFRKLTE